jgi:hypothetical protein
MLRARAVEAADLLVKAAQYVNLENLSTIIRQYLAPDISAENGPAKSQYIDSPTHPSAGDGFS